MGHRLPNHGGQCRHLHGHRYAAEFWIDGSVEKGLGNSDEGMVLDFGQAKRMLREMLAQLDHRFLVSATDEYAGVLEPLPGVVLVPFVPTAEHIAALVLANARRALFGGPSNSAYVSGLRLYETPTAWVETT